MDDKPEQPPESQAPPGEDEQGVFADAVDAVRESSRTRRIEVFAAILMAVATIGTAWAGYQSGRWGSVQTIKFNEGNAARVNATALSTRGGQEVVVDVALFYQATGAFARGDMDLTEFYIERARDGFKPALDAWVASMPLLNPDAAPTPFDLPEYSVAEFEQSEALIEEAVAAKVVALQANQRSDNYVLSVVVFAAILLLAGISARFRRPRIKIVLLSLASVGFIANTLWVATFPVTFSV